MRRRRHPRGVIVIADELAEGVVPDLTTLRPVMNKDVLLTVVDGKVAVIFL